MVHQPPPHTDDDGSGKVRTVATPAQRRARLDLVMALLRENAHATPIDLERLAEEGAGLAAGLGDEAAAAFCRQQLGAGAFALGRYGAARSHLQNALRLYLRTERAATLLMLGRAHLRLHDPERGVSALREGLAIATENGDADASAAAFAALGEAFAGNGDHVAALEHYFQGLAIRERLDDPVGTGIICCDIGLLYAHIGDFTAALPFLGRSLESFRISRIPHLEVVVLGSIGTVHLSLGDHDTGLETALRLLMVQRRLGNREGEAEALLMAATCQQRQGRLHEALGGFLHAHQLAGALGDERLLAAALMGLGECRGELYDYWNGVNDLEGALGVARRLGDPRLELRAEEALGRMFEDLGDSDRALAHLKRSLRLREELHGEENRRNLASLEMRIRAERTERERDELRTQAEQLRGKVEAGSDAISALSFAILRRNEMLGTLARRLAPLRFNAEPEELKAILGELESLRDRAGEQTMPEAGFLEAHGEFISLLLLRHPGLTRTELKICVLVKSDRSTKDIAEVLYLSERTVENHRYRIRRKMELPASTSLGLYLRMLQPS